LPERGGVVTHDRKVAAPLGRDAADDDVPVTAESVSATLYIGASVVHPFVAYTCSQWLRAAKVLMTLGLGAGDAAKKGEGDGWRSAPTQCG
jgi:hypothetical protein